MAQNFTPLNVSRFQKKATASSGAVDKVLFVVAVFTAVVLITLIVILIRRNG